MAHIHRVIFIALFLASSVVSAQTIYSLSGTFSRGTASVSVGSMEAFASAWADAFNAVSGGWLCNGERFPPYYVLSDPVISGLTVTYTRTLGEFEGMGGCNPAPAQVTTISYTATKTCAPGYSDPGGAAPCVPDPPPGEDEDIDEIACASASGSTRYMQFSGRVLPGASACGQVPGNSTNRGCTVTLSDMAITATDRTTGQTITEADVTVGSEPCNMPTGEVDSCPNGASGTVNGISVCVEYDPHQNVIETTRGSTQTTTVVDENENETTTETTTTQEVTCDGDKCTVQTTTTVNGGPGNPGGSSTSTTSEIPRSDYCKDNPTAPGCKEGSFGGSCSAGFTCSGDAAMCAIARATHEQNCLLERTSDESALYATAKATEGTGLTETEVDVTGTITATNDLGVAGACITNKSITVWGRSVEIPFSDICPYLAQLGLLLQAVSWLGAFAIVARR